MSQSKIIIEKTIEAKEGASFVLNSGFTVLPPTTEGGNALIVSYRTEPLKKRKGSVDPDEAKAVEQILEKEKAERLEWQHKWHIREGSFSLNRDYGWLSYALPEEVYFETETSKYLTGIFNQFLNKKDVIIKYKKNKRSYLLHSDPGMGKSALIRNFCRTALTVPGTSVLHTDGDADFAFLTQIFSLPYSEKVERIILVIEDFGKKHPSTAANIYNGACLNFLDGMQSLFRVPTLILTTTNFLRDLGPQLTSRPGRFSKIIKVSPPSDEEVFSLIEYVSGISLTGEQKSVLAGKSFTPDYCVEAILRSEFEGVSLDHAVEEMAQEQRLLSQ